MTAAKADAHDAFEHLFYILILHMCAVPRDLTAAVSIGHLRIRVRSGAKAWPVVASVITCLTLFAVLFYNMAVTAPSSAIALGATLATSFLVEVVYRRATGRTFKKVLRQTGHLPGAATRDKE